MTNIETEFLTIGGGIGSFTWVDALRTHGVSTKDIAIISPLAKPYQQLKTYCETIGLTSHTRLRSDSGARPDNLWGFPGYGLSESLNHFKQGHLATGSKYLYQLFTESAISPFYSPQPAQVYKSIDREMKRINYASMLKSGTATKLQKLPDGRTKITYQTNNNSHAIITRVLHLSLGHSPKHTTSKHISAYQLPKDFWSKLKTKGGTIALIGRGSTAATILETLIDLKQAGTPLTIISIIQNKTPSQTDYRHQSLPQFHHWKLQQFNWPRSSFGGPLHTYYAHSTTEHKRSLSQTWGSPSAVPRKSWQAKVQAALDTGYYHLTTDLPPSADHVIDCTGFSNNVTTNPFYQSIIKTYDLPLTSTNGFRTDQHFQIPKLSDSHSATFVSGIGASGNHFGPIDSFLGHQFITYQTLHYLYRQPYAHINPLGIQSLPQWLKWITNKQI